MEQNKLNQESIENAKQSRINQNKWRLILGGTSKSRLSFEEDAGGYTVEAYESMEDMLDYLYGMEHGDEVRREGGSGPSQLYAATWISRVRDLFPKKTVEILEKQALEQFHLTELLTDKETLEKLEPNMDLMKTILQFKHLMGSEVLLTAKRIVKKVVDELTEKIKKDIKRSNLGKIDRNRSSHVKSIRNLDIRKTIQQNLKYYDKEKKQLVLKNVYFNSRVKQYHKYRIIIAVDESGSMMDSVIYSAIMAGIFASLPMLETKLIIFDTQVVDLSGHIDEPVDILMGMQLGGGTNIGGAMAYCESLCQNPYETIYVTVTDLYEGGSQKDLLRICSRIISSGSKMIFLTALDRDSNPSYDKRLGQKLANMGAFVGAMTPEQLGDYIGKMIQR